MTRPDLFRGVLTPASTPFTRDYGVDADRFAAFCKWQLAEGANGLAIFGTTSEANSIALEERMEMLDRLIEAGVPAASLLPGTGTCALADTVRLTAHAVRAGCGGVLVLPPFYYKNPSEDGLFASFAEVIERVGDDRLRLYLYHFPQMAGVGIPLAVVERLVAAYPETVCGLKDSSGDWSNTEALIRAIPGFAVFPSSESRALDALSIGGAGCISATANINVRAIRRMIDHAGKPDAAAMHETAAAVRKVMEGYPLVPAVKAVLAHYSGDAEWARTCPPLTPLPKAKAAELVTALERAGLTLSFTAEAAE